MIINLIINVMLNLSQLFINLIPKEDTTDLVNMMINSITTLIDAIGTGINFTHYVVGDAIIIIIPSTLGLLGFKFIVYPIIDFVRRLIPFVNL